MSTPPRVVVVGGGAGGLELTTRLGRRLGRRGLAQITLIDSGRTHIWKPLLHQVAAGSFDGCLHSIEYLAQAQRNHFRFRMGRLESLERTERRLWLAATLNDDGDEIIPRRSFEYDLLVLSVGSQSNDFGVAGVKENAWFLDSKNEAVTFQKNLMEKLIHAVTHKDQLQPGELDVAIVGAGATGVELAAQLHQVTRRLRDYGFAHLDPDRHIRIKILDAAPRILPSLPERLSDAVRDELSKLGVTTHVSEVATRVGRDGVTMASGHFYPAAITVWAAGIKAPDALRELGIRVNGINQVEVGADLLSYDDNNIYALGDCAALPVGEDGQTVPPRAQAAHQQASHIAQAIERRLAGRPVGRPYRYRDYGSLVTLGRYSTVGSLMGSIAGNVWISGVIARLVYLSLYKMHQVTLHGLWNTTLLTLSSLLRRSVNPEVKLH